MFVLNGLHRRSKGWMSPTVSITLPTPGLELLKGALSHAAAAGRNKDHIVTVADVRRAHLTQSLSRRRSSTCLSTTTSTPGLDAAGDGSVACGGRDRLQGRGNVK